MFLKGIPSLSSKKKGKCCYTFSLYNLVWFGIYLGFKASPILEIKSCKWY